jgi:hypothetical protein
MNFNLPLSTATYFHQSDLFTEEDVSLAIRQVKGSKAEGLDYFNIYQLKGLDDYSKQLRNKFTGFAI